MLQLKYIFVLLFISAPVVASEIDDFHAHYKPVRDSEQVLNERVELAIKNALSKTSGCDTKEFGDFVSKDLVSIRLYSGAMERFAYSDPRIDRVKPNLKQSIYGEGPFAKSLPGMMYGIDPTLSVAGVKLGTDKIGHFIDHGFNLFRLLESGGTIEEVLGKSVEEEEGAFGLFTTGVKSYADIVSNMEGVEFWENIYGKGKLSYTACVDGKLVQSRPFRFSDFVNPAWNEATNCSEFAVDWEKDPEDEESKPQLWTPRGGEGKYSQSVRESLVKLEAEEGRRYACPIEVDDCKKAWKHYEGKFGKELAQRMISPACQALIK